MLTCHDLLCPIVCMSQRYIGHHICNDKQCKFTKNLQTLHTHTHATQHCFKTGDKYFKGGGNTASKQTSRSVYS